MTQNQDASKLVAKARAQLIMGHPFFAALALRMQTEEDSSLPPNMPMVTDGRRLAFRPDFVESLRPDQLQGVIAHEAMHCALGHLWRRNGRDPKRWNIAGDFKINQVLTEAGLALPDGGLLDPAYNDMSADEIYNVLPEDDGDGDDGDGNYGNCGCFTDPTDDDGKPASKAEASVQEQEWKAALVQAANVARKAGALPGSMSDLVDEVVKPKVCWRDVLRHFIQSCTDLDDCSWIPSNRRFAHTGMYLPSRRSTKLPHIVVAFDTSGSVSKAELEAFVGELNSILQEKPTTVTTIMCDTKVQAVKEYTPYDLPLTGVETPGRGGTHFQPVFDHLDSLEEEPACVIYATDGYPCDTPKDPGIPVVWVTTQNEQFAKFGEVIKIEV